VALARGDLTRIRELTGSEVEPARLPPADERWDGLSEVERSIALLVSEGLTNRQIARRVGLSPHTVNYHLRGMFRKLGVSSRVELARHIPSHVERLAA
jgi:DNA-binding CsgD family transcriptional regulator